MSIGKAIKLCRIQRNLSLQQLADKAGVSVSYLSLIERGKRDPIFSVVGSIAAAMNMPLVVLVFLGETDENNVRLGKEICEKLSYMALR